MIEDLLSWVKRASVALLLPYCLFALDDGVGIILLHDFWC